MWIDEEMPLLAVEGYQITSEATNEYNCIAYVFGETDRWWSHAAGRRLLLARPREPYTFHSEPDRGLHRAGLRTVRGRQR